MRGQVCRLQLLLALASAVIFWSLSPRTRGHILLSKIRDFPFRRLLRLAGSRWRFDPASTRGDYSSAGALVIQPLGTDSVENTVSNISSILARGLVGVEHICFAVVT
jgi:hypothetical protein